MYCENCGAKIPEGAMFCEKCGSPVVQVEQEKTAKKSYKKGWIVGGLIGCAGVAAIAAVLFNLGIIGGGNHAEGTENVSAQMPEATVAATEQPAAIFEAGDGAADGSQADSDEPESADEKEKNSFLDKPEDTEDEGEDNSQENFSEMNTPEEAYADYLAAFIDAVNTGETAGMALVMTGKSHREQCAMAENYYSRGIHEELQSYSVLSVKWINDGCVKLNAREKIKVSYADGSSQTVKQKYRYTCRWKADGRWYIAGMKALP